MLGLVLYVTFPKPDWPARAIGKTKTTEGCYMPITRDCGRMGGGAEAVGWAKPSESVASLGHSQLWPVNCKWGLRKQQDSSLGIVGVETFLRTSDPSIQNQSGPRYVH